MTLSDVLREYNNRDFDIIEYRHMRSNNSEEDVLYGFAVYKNKMLGSVDGDDYHLSDKIVKHEIYQPNWLIVWV